jgi:hypothetical protein
VPDLTKKNRYNMGNTGRDAISALKMSQRLTADVDAWARAHDTVCSDAILVVKQIDQLLDPTLRRRTAHPQGWRSERFKRIAVASIESGQI